MSNPAVVIVHKCGFWRIPIDDFITSLTLLFFAAWYSSISPNEALNPSNLEASAANTFKVEALRLNFIPFKCEVRYFPLGSNYLANS
mgnify:FL=1